MNWNWLYWCGLIEDTDLEELKAEWKKEVEKIESQECTTKGTPDEKKRSSCGSEKDKIEKDVKFEKNNKEILQVFTKWKEFPYVHYFDFKMGDAKDFACEKQIKSIKVKHIGLTRQFSVEISTNKKENFFHQKPQKNMHGAYPCIAWVILLCICQFIIYLSICHLLVFNVYDFLSCGTEKMEKVHFWLPCSLWCVSCLLLVDEKVLVNKILCPSIF